MNPTILGQARRLLRTIRRLQTRVLVKTVQTESEDGSPRRELTVPQMTMLLVIRDLGEMGIKALAEETQVSAPSASAMVDRLVEAGMLCREASRTDRREVRVSLTAEGVKTVGILEEHLLKSLTDMLEKVGPDMAGNWCEIYARIDAILDEEARESVPSPLAKPAGEVEGSTVA